MFGIFTPEDVEHPAFGAMKWHRGWWEGKLEQVPR